MNKKSKLKIYIKSNKIKEKIPVHERNIDEVDFITGWCNAGWSKHGGGWINKW
jgi:hypothetical protein